MNQSTPHRRINAVSHSAAERISAPARHENHEQTDQAAPAGGGSGAALCSAGVVVKIDPSANVWLQRAGDRVFVSIGETGVQLNRQQIQEAAAFFQSAAMLPYMPPESTSGMFDVTLGSVER